MDYMFGNQECSSGCESGWTDYFEHTSISADDACFGRRKDPNGAFTDAKRSNNEEEDEEEDLSMVSDASSGPPHLHGEEGYGGNDKNGCFYHYTIDEASSRTFKKKKSRENRGRNKAQEHSSLLDDTASSVPSLDFCNKTRRQPSEENVVEYSQGYSTTQFEVRPPYEEHCGFYQSSLSGNQLHLQQRQQQNQWFEDKRW